MSDLPKPVDPFAVTVFLSSATKVDRLYFDAAADFGRAIAKEGWTLVYGGNRIGCMGALADGAREAGGRVVGVTPRYFIDEGVADHACDELLVTDTMRERKHLLEQRASAFVALPGGLGTFEELFEIVVSRQLGMHKKPVMLLNVNDYYTPLLQLIERGIEQKFVRPGSQNLISVASTIPEMIELLKVAAKPPVA
ncbi:MAG: TIGR00730 family Rossman fold protein [Tepidisphaeraceae bacterium]